MMDKKVVKIVVNNKNGKTYAVYNDGTYKVVDTDNAGVFQRSLAEKIPEPVQAAYSGFQKGADVVDFVDEAEGIEKDYPTLTKLGKMLGLTSSAAGAAGLLKSAATTGAKQLAKHKMKKLASEMIEDAPIEQIMKRKPQPPQSATSKLDVDAWEDAPISEIMKKPKVKAEEIPDVEVNYDKDMLRNVLEDMRQEAVQSIKQNPPVKKIDSAVESVGQRAARDWRQKELDALAKKEAEAALKRRKK